MTKADAYWDEQKFLHDLINQLPMGIFWKNTASVFLGCNQFFAQLAGLSSPREIVGKMDCDLPWPKEQADRFYQDDQAVLQKKEAKSVNEYQGILINKIPLFTRTGKLIGLLGICKKKADSETDSMTNVLHDIRMPLSGIIGMTKLLEESLHTAAAKQQAKWINKSGEQLCELLNNILVNASYENFAETVHPINFNLRQTIENIVHLEQPKAKMKNLDLRIEIDKNIPDFIVGDVSKLQRIILNLLDNSIKFTEKGHVAIQVQKKGEYREQIQVEFTVVDTGVGIPKNLQEKIFERFYSIESSQKEIQQGVGLDIVRNYIKLLGGKFKLTSAPKKGTTFDFLLSFSHPTKDEKQAELPRLLLVEDNIIALRIAETLAKQLPCSYATATDGESALALVKTENFDLILTDLGLPGISGSELTQKIRQWEDHLQKKPVPIIGLTAHILGETEQKCLQSGMNKVLVKPIYLQTLQGLMKQFLPNKLGRDLPDTEKKLFELQDYPLLDVAVGIKNLGHESVLKDLLQLMIAEAIPEDLHSLEKAHAAKNWKEIEGLAHKMKSGAIYCGTIKMQYACQYLERYRKAGHSELLEDLYQQLLQTVQETKQYIENWLRQHS